MNHCLIYSLQQQPYLWVFSDGSTIEVNGNFQTNNILSLIRAVTQGIGIAYVPVAFIQEELKNKRLILLFPSYYAHDYEIYAYYHRAAQENGWTKKYLHYLKSKLKKS